jgi:hypothetical protein
MFSLKGKPFIKTLNNGLRIGFPSDYAVDGDETGYESLSIGWGYCVSAFGRHSLAMGGLEGHAYAWGDHSVAIGKNVSANQLGTQAFGIGTKTSASGQMAIGVYNNDDSNALFIVGVGSADNDRANAFAVGNDGTNDYITIGEEKLTESELKTIKAGGGSTGSVEWASIQNKPNIHVANGGGVKIGRAPEPVSVFETSENSLAIGRYDDYLGAPGSCSIAFGSVAYPSGSSAVRAVGNNSIAGGVSAAADHNQSQAFGYVSQTGRTEQMVVGKYNAVDETAYLVVGDGDTAQLDWPNFDDTRPGSRNCFTVGNDGTEDYITLGDIKLTKSKLERLLALLDLPNAEDSTF